MKKNPRKSHPGHRARLTLDQIQGSNRLRLKAQSTGWSNDEIAKVCKCHPDTIKKWLTGDQFMNPERQALLDAHWSVAQ
jgi:hypothetical protein